VVAIGASQLSIGRLSSKIPPIRFKTLSKTAFTLRAQAIARMTTERRTATLVAWAYVMEAIAMDDAPLKIVDKKWAAWVSSENGSIDRRAYTFCVLEKLLEGLRRRDLYVSSGEKWSNPRAKLLQGKAWESARTSVCRTLELNSQPEPELKVLQKQLNQAYSQTALNLPNNSKVRIEKDKKGKETLTISNLDKLDDPESYLKLKDKVESLLPQVDLPEVLLEINAKTGFMDEFTHLNESFAKVKDLSISICAVLIAQGCNIGLSPLVRKRIPALTRGNSDVVFGLFWLLGYQFSPRLADAGSARFWRLDSSADYGLLDNLARQTVKTERHGSPNAFGLPPCVACN
jgi:hypothetical protein